MAIGGKEADCLLEEVAEVADEGKNFFPSFWLWMRGGNTRIEALREQQTFGQDQRASITVKEPEDCRHLDKNQRAASMCV